MTRVGRAIATTCAAFVLGTIAGGQLPLGLTAQPAAAARPRCVGGFDIVASMSKMFPEGVVARSARRAIIAGGVPLGYGRRAAAIARIDGRHWRLTATRALGRDAAYMGVDRTAGAVWAVGYVRVNAGVRPLAARQGRSGGWRFIATPPRGDATLTDVSVDRAAGTWAVGYIFGQPARHKPWALRWDGRRFVDRSPILRDGESGRLTAVSVDREAGTWVAGSVIRAGVVLPYIGRLREGSWQRQSLPDVGEAVVADIDMHGSGSGWAVGYRQAPSGVTPLVLRWDGSDWTSMPVSDVTDGIGLLLGASAKGRAAMVVGAVWDRSGVRFEGLAARAGTDGWESSTLGRLRGHTGLMAVDVADGSRAWVAARAAKAGAVARTCDRTASPGRSSGGDRESRPGKGGATSRPAGSEEDVADPVVPRPSEALPTAPRLRVSAGGGIRLRDRTASARLPRSSVTWGAVIADFDGDNDDDIFLGRHGARARLFLHRGARFRDADVAFGGVDRHGCAADDVDESGLPDLYCSVGGRRGTGIKANQLWLDPAGPGPRQDSLAGRAAEPLGRGRVAAFLDVDHDGDDDLFVGQESERMDGLPSDNRVYLRAGPARFGSVGGSGIDPSLSARAVSVGDVEADRRTDLLLIYETPHSRGVTGGLRLYRNIGGRFRDSTRAERIRSIGESDAALGDLDGDGRADLIQLSASRIRISLKRTEGFRAVFERRLPGGVAVAVGDADGDGDRDIYVLRQKDRPGDDDVLLLGKRSGRDWEAIRVPSRHGGIADDVYPIHRGSNGRTDFLVLNGRGQVAGPVQLIAMVRR